MADNNAYIGYRSAGRRPESQQDRRASADAPLSALRGMLSGVLGAPGDIESLVRMLPGLSERTVLPTSEDVERRLPMPELNQTPTGRAFTTAGQLGGGFYNGPLSPLRAIAALPSAVSRAGRDFLLSTSPVHVVKPKGGNWMEGSVERAVEPMNQYPGTWRPVPMAEREAKANAYGVLAAPWRDARGMTASDEVVSSQITPEMSAMNRWLETKLGKYMKNEMATPEDPLRALAERGVLHVDPQQIGLNRYLASDLRRKSGNQAMGESEAAKAWEDASDVTIGEMPAGELLRQGYAEQMPWLAKVSPETPVYLPSQSDAASNLGFTHLADELRNAINPASGLPENLLWKYQDLEKVTVPQAVERVAKINEWRAAQKAEADMARAMNPATQVVKEYPEQGFKWVELRQPKELPEGWAEARKPSGEVGAYYDPSGATVYDHPGVKTLEDALKYEGETMGHCVGGYCPDVVEGRSKIYSLRDKKGQPHVTIEVQPGRKLTEKDMPDDVRDMLSEQYADASREEFEGAVQQYLQSRSVPDAIVQIKGKANRAPNAEYLPAVQDFVRSGNFGKIGDLKNTGLVDLQQMGVPAEMRGGQRFVTEDEYKDIVRKNAEGFAEGGQVRGYAKGGQVSGANFPTDDFDPARIDAIVGELHAMNAG